MFYVNPYDHHSLMVFSCILHLVIVDFYRQILIFHSSIFELFYVMKCRRRDSKGNIRHGTGYEDSV